MYNSQETIFRIKQRAKEQGIAILDLQTKCDLGRNAISQAAKSQDGMKARNLFAIAEVLDCSVDYLLGRTDRPEISQSYSNNSISNSNNIAFGENSSVKITNEEIEKEICKVLSGLNLRERSELLTIIYNFVDEHKSEELK